MDFQFKGTVLAVLPIKTGSKKDGNGTWASQQYVIENTDDKYPKRLVCDVFGQDKINEFGLKVGQEVNAYFNIDGQEWQGKWFGKNSLWKVDKLSSNSTTQAPVAQPQDNGSDLPF